MKRLVVMLALGLLAVGLSCASVVAADQVVIQLESGLATDTWRGIIEEYDRLHDDVEVILVSVGRNGYFDRLQSQLMGGAVVPDIVQFNDVQLATFADAGFLEPLNDYLSNPELTPADFDWEDFIPRAREASTYKGKIYTFPFDLSTYHLFYRKDLIPEPPETWDEYIELARKFTRSINPESPTKYGTTQQGARGSLPPKEWSMRFWSYGGDYMTEDGKIKVNTDVAKKALQDRVDIYRIEKVVPPDAINYSFPETITALQQGLVAMAIQWNAAYPIFLDPQQSPLIADKVAATLVPGIRQADGTVLHVPFVQNQNLAINARSRQKEQAYKLLVWMNSKQNHVAFALGGGGTPGTPARASAFEDPTVQSKRPEFALLFESLEAGKGFPAHPRWVQIHETLDEAIARAVSGEATVERALEDAQAKLDSILGQ